MLLPPYHLSDEQRSNNASDWDNSVSQLRLRNRQPFWKFYFDSELSRLVQQSFPQIYGAFHRLLFRAEMPGINFVLPLALPMISALLKSINILIRLQ